MNYFLLQFRTGSPAQISRSGHFAFHAEAGHSLVFEGRIHRLPGVGTVADWKGEVIARKLLQIYLVSGEQCFEKVEGDFSLIVASRKRTVCYRSLLSWHQIYFSRHQLSNRLLLALPPGQSPSLNPDYLLRFFYYRCPNYSFLEATPLLGVNRLRAGFCIHFGANGEVERESVLAPRHCFVLDDPGQRKEDIAPLVRDRIEESTKTRVASFGDRPVVCEVSGGLDSSFIAAILAGHVPRVSGYMFSYPASPSHKASEKSAVTLASKCGVELQVIDPRDLETHHFSQAFPYSDEPSPSFWQGALFGKTMASLCPEKAVIFSGAGSDQLFSRNTDYLLHLLRSRKIGQYWSTLRDISDSLERSRVSLGYQSLLSLFPKEPLARLSKRTKRWVVDPIGESELIPELVLYENIEWIVSATGTNRASDAISYLRQEREEFSRSVRCAPFQEQIFYGGGDTVFAPYLRPHDIHYESPYVDLNLVDFVMNEVSAHLIHDWRSPHKGLLRLAQNGIVPDEVRLRPKSEFHFDGYQLSLFQKNEGFLRTFLREEREILDWPWLDRKQLLRCLDQYYFGVRTKSVLRFVALIGYLLWWRDFKRAFIERKAHPPGRSDAGIMMLR